MKWPKIFLMTVKDDNSLVLLLVLINLTYAFSDVLVFLIDYSEQTRELLTGAAYVHLKHAEVSKYTRNLSPASQAILLSGPAGVWLSIV